jgi:hypothetical protein
MKCKFCGCSDKRPCLIPMVIIRKGVDDFSDDEFTLAAPGQVANFTLACSWIAPEICSAPGCVERGYKERWELVEQLLTEGLAA